MGTTPQLGGGTAAHLAWLSDHLGGSGTWLVETDTRHHQGYRRHSQLTSDLVATLDELTANLPDSWCPDGALEVTGPTAAELSADHHHELRTFLEVDTLDLRLADPSHRDTVVIEAARLPHRYIAPLRRLTDRPWDDWQRTLISSLIGSWHNARHREIGLSPRAGTDEPRRWAAAGHTILTSLAERDRLSIDNDRRHSIETAAQQLLVAHGLPLPHYGPLAASDLTVREGGRRTR